MLLELDKFPLEFQQVFFFFFFVWVFFFLPFSFSFQGPGREPGLDRERPPVPADGAFGNSYVQEGAHAVCAKDVVARQLNGVGERLHADTAIVLGVAKGVVNGFGEMDLQVFIPVSFVVEAALDDGEDDFGVGSPSSRGSFQNAEEQPDSWWERRAVSD